MTKMCMRCGYKVRDNAESCPLCKVDFEEIVPEKVGLFGNKSKQREIEFEFEKEFGVKIVDLKEELRKQTLLDRYNLHKGLKFKVFLPEEEIVLKQHSGLTKGIVTYAFGLPGMAATSGVKQEKKQKNIKTVLQIVDAGIIFKNASKEGKDIRIPFEHIVSFVEHKAVNRTGSFTLTLLENQKLDLYLNEFMYKEQKRRGSDLYYLYDYISETINSKATGSQNAEELKWNPDLKNNNSEIINETKEESGSLMDELERLGNMYKEGLLTDEEFAIAKKKLLEGD